MWGIKLSIYLNQHFDHFGYKNSYFEINTKTFTKIRKGKDILEIICKIACVVWQDVEDKDNIIKKLSRVVWKAWYG